MEQLNKITGNRWRNWLWGTSSPDAIVGRKGNDHLRGFGGDDVLSGGTGSDVFIFEKDRASNGLDTIVDYHWSSAKHSEADVLDLSMAIYGLGCSDSIDDYAWLIEEKDGATLYINRDGSGPGSAQAEAFASLAGLKAGDEVCIRTGSTNSFFRCLSLFGQDFVLNVNHDPVFDEADAEKWDGSYVNGEYSFCYDENQDSTSTVIGMVHATDADSDPVTYSITTNVQVDNGAGGTTEAFAIDATTGEITLTTAGLAAFTNDYEDRENPTSNAHEITVSVSDGIGSDVAVKVHLEETNDISDDAPELLVTTSAGSDVNELILHVTSKQAFVDEKVELAFLGFPGGKIFDENGNEVTNGIDDFFAGTYAGEHDFTVVFDDGTDLNTTIRVEVTGEKASSSQNIGLHYDVNETGSQNIAFTNTDQNMWGDFGTPVIGWHEYLPILGTDFMQWDNTDEMWVDTSVNGDNYWRADANLVDIDFSLTTEELFDAATAFYTDTVNDAITTLENGLSSLLDKLLSTFGQGTDSMYNWGVTTGLISDREDPVWKLASVLSIAFVNPVLNFFNDGWGNNPSDPDYYFWNGIPVLAADMIINENASLPEALKYAGAAYYNDTSYSYYNLLSNRCLGNYEFNYAPGLSINEWELWRDIVNVIVEVPTSVLGAIWDNIQSLLGSLSNFFDNIDMSNVISRVSEITDKATELLNLPSLEDFANSGVALDLSLDADAYGRAGIQIDAELDGGSVDTNVQYIFSSVTQYNQTTDMLAITPTLVNVTDGDVVAFSTASPNISFSAKLLYDVGAQLDLNFDGEVIFGDTTIDLDGNPDGSLNFKPMISTGGTNMQFDFSAIADKADIALLLTELMGILKTPDFPAILDFIEANADIKLNMLDKIVPFTELFILPENIDIEIPALPVDELTIVNFDTKEEKPLSFLDGLVALDPQDVLNGIASNTISGLTEGMVQSLGFNLPSILTDGTYLSRDALAAMYKDSFAYLLQQPLGYDADTMGFGDLINEYYYDEFFSTVNPEQLMSLIKNSTVMYGDTVLTFFNLAPAEWEALGYSELAGKLINADLGSLLDLLPDGSDINHYILQALEGVGAEIVDNFSHLFDGIGGKYDTGTFIKVDMSANASDALYHFNSFNFNTDNIINALSNGTSGDIATALGDNAESLLSPYTDPDINENTASFGLFAASGESDEVLSITVDADNVMAFIIKQVLALVSAEVGQIIPAELTNPFDLSLSLDTLLRIVNVDPNVAATIQKFFDFNLEQEKMDYDITYSTDFSQEFTLTVDDMEFRLTFTETADENGENAVIKSFKASEADKIIITDASQYDVDQDGTINYDLQIAPTAMFSNDTELGYNFAPSLDFLKTVLKGKLSLPLGELTGISVLPTLSLGFDYTVGPILEVDAEINALDVDVYESRFAMDIGNVIFEDNEVNIDLIGVQDQGEIILA